MKGSLLSLLILLAIGNASGQVVYFVYASEPSGMLVSPNTFAKPNTATVKSGQKIVLNGYYDQGLALWYGEGLPADGAVFGTSVQLINTGSENVTRTFKVNNSSTNAITVTVLPQQGVAEPTVSVSNYCLPNPVLTAVGCSGSVKWYTRSTNQYNQVSKTEVAGAVNAAFTATMPNTYFASCTVEGVESFGSEVIVVGASGVQPGIFLKSPHPEKTYPNAKSNICMWSDYTLEAEGLGLDAGTVTWYEKVGTNAVHDIGNGPIKNVKITNLKTNYYATLEVPGCATKTSPTHEFAVQAPSSLATGAERNFKAHVQGMNILSDDNCQFIAGFAPSDNNNGVNVMLGKNITARVTRDMSVKSYNGQPYLQRHFDLEPENPAEAQNAWYSIVMYFTQEDFDAFNAVSSVKLPSNNSAEEQQKLANLRIWQAHGTPSSLPATPGNYTEGPVTDYGCVACRSSSWNDAKGLWEVILNTVGFSGFFITAEGATALPVTLLNFKANKAENEVVLYWQTSEESNSDRFEIQRSADAKNWDSVGEVRAKGESKLIANYSFLDPLSLLERQPMANSRQSMDLYYRLKMLDLDGTFAYSRIASVDFHGTAEIKIFPNPAVGALHFTSDTPVVGYKIMNLAGETIFEKSEIEIVRESIRLSGIQEGVYLLRLTRKDGTIYTKPVIITK